MLGGIVEVFVVPGGESGENVAREILSGELDLYCFIRDRQ